MQVDSKQLKAIEHTGTPLLVTAGPGSGKTRVITERIKFLIRAQGLKPSDILCLTFSEKAASELKERLENDDDLEDIDISEMSIGTYHSFCYNLLLDNTIHTGLGMNGGILDPALALVWGVKNIDKFQFDSHVEIGNNATEVIQKMMDGISVFHDQLVPIEKLEGYVADKLKSIGDGNADNDDDTDTAENTEYIHLLGNLAKIYRHYQEFKKNTDVMDYDDLVVAANRLLGDGSTQSATLRRLHKYKHILIDEFQDNNFAQFSVVKKLVIKDGITAVGDADQNIYRFQGAYTEIFQDFKNTFANYTEITLTKNWRNPKSVIDLTGQLLRQDKHREPKTTYPTKDDAQKVRVVECSSEHAQSDFILKEIGKLMQQNPQYTFGDFAILSRRQIDGLHVAKVLGSNGIPIKYIGKSQFHDSSSARLLFSYLRVIADPMNAIISITRILQEYGITEQNISKINHEASIRAKNNPDGDYAFDVLSDRNVPRLTQKQKIAEVFSTIQDLLQIAKNKPPSHVIHQIIRVKTAIYKKIADDDSVDHFIERSVLKDILDRADSYEKINPDSSIKEFLEFIQELEKFDVETALDTFDKDALQVSTIHKSKGLEFKTVFIIDVAANRIPLRYTKKPFYVPEEISSGVQPAADPKEEFTREERRVLYVGMTRTVDNLFLLYPTQYEGNKRPNKASKFLVELDPENNPDVDFKLYHVDGNSSNDSDASASFDAVRMIRNEQLELAIKHLYSEQYSSAIQRILNLSAIKFFDEEKTVEGFSFDGLSSQTIDDDVKSRLEGTKPEKLGFADDDHLSFSKFDKYRKCPKQFWYQYILKALPRRQTSPAMYKGSLFHKLAEESAMRQIAGNVDTAERLQDEFEKKWRSENYLGHSATKEKQDRQSLAPALQTYWKWNDSNPNEIVAVELPFAIDVGGFKVRGVIDRVERTFDGHYVIIDYKTGSAKSKDKRIDDDGRLQLNLYSMALRENPDYGVLPVKAAYFYVERRAGSQIFEHAVDSEQVDETKASLEQYAKSIRNKEFDATPSIQTCKWCEYSDICDEAVK